MAKAKKTKKLGKLKTYKIGYYFDGNGEQIIKARSKEEAMDKFYEGDFISEEEWGENYISDSIVEVE